MTLALGCCCPPSDAAACATAGFDYIEIPLDSLEERHATTIGVDELESKPAVIMGLFPPGMKLTGADVKRDLITRRILQVSNLLAETCIDTLIFGGSQIRSVPEGWSRLDGYRQLAEVLHETSLAYAPQQVKIGIEIISNHETNLLNTIGEARWFLDEYNLRSIGIVVDLNQLEQQQDNLSDIFLLKDRLLHAHVPERPSNESLKQRGYSFSEFFAELSKIGYEGRVSIESPSRRFGENTTASLNCLRLVSAAYFD